MINKVETLIKEEIKKKIVNNIMLIGLRNIKSDYMLLATTPGNKLTQEEIVKILIKNRKEIMSIYEDTNKELYDQGKVEYEFLKQYVPEDLNEEDVISFLNILEIEKVPKNFKLFQAEIKKHFGQDADSKLITSWIKNA